MAHAARTLVGGEWSRFAPARGPDLSMGDSSPVKRLMLAVLDRAVNDLRTYAVVPTPRGRRIFSEIDAWFRASTDGVFDFETICTRPDSIPISSAKACDRRAGWRRSARVDPRRTKAKIAEPSARFPGL